MLLSPLDQLHLNASAGFLQIGEPMDAWTELEMISPGLKEVWQQARPPVAC